MNEPAWRRAFANETFIFNNTPHFNRIILERGRRESNVGTAVNIGGLHSQRRNRQRRMMIVMMMMVMIEQHVMDLLLWLLKPLAHRRELDVARVYRVHFGEEARRAAGRRRQAVA